MNLDLFNAAFVITAESDMRSLEPNVYLGDERLRHILGPLGGKTFNNGLYRVFRVGQIVAARDSIEVAFPEYKGRVVPFAFDWLGRHFALDNARVEKGYPQVLMFEIGAGEAMEIPANVFDFHNIELVNYANESLALQFWKLWRASNSADLAFSDCVGYKVPLFLGGKDELANLEQIDMDVYVEICGQLRNKTRMLRPGETIRRVSFR